MEYLLGSLVTLVTIFVINKTINKKIKDGFRLQPTTYTQSFIHDVLSPFLPTNFDLADQARPKTQASKHLAKNTVKVLFTENKAYWIKDNSVYSADVDNGVVDEESAYKLDIMGMDDVQLKEISFIVEKLTEGVDDENRYSGQ